MTSDAAVATASVTLTASDATATNIYYTLDGSTVLTGDGPSDTALRYTAPIQVTSATPIELRAVAFDTSNNHSDTQRLPARVLVGAGSSGLGIATASGEQG